MGSAHPFVCPRCSWGSCWRSILHYCARKSVWPQVKFSRSLFFSTQTDPKIPAFLTFSVILLFAGRNAFFPPATIKKTATPSENFVKESNYPLAFLPQGFPWVAETFSGNLCRMHGAGNTPQTNPVSFFLCQLGPADGTHSLYLPCALVH